MFGRHLGYVMHCRLEESMATPSACSEGRKTEETGNATGLSSEEGGRSLGSLCWELPGKGNGRQSQRTYPGKQFAPVFTGLLAKSMFLLSPSRRTTVHHTLSWKEPCLCHCPLGKVQTCICQLPGTTQAPEMSHCISSWTQQSRARQSCASVNLADGA